MKSIIDITYTTVSATADSGIALSTISSNNIYYFLIFYELDTKGTFEYCFLYPSSCNISNVSKIQRKLMGKSPTFDR